MDAYTTDNGIGDAAGNVWKFLEENGPTSSNKLAKELEFPRDIVMQGIGWLAREDKIEFIEGKRGKSIALK